MVKVYNNIYVGNQEDFYKIRLGEWAVVHCCKDPFHKELVGYKGNLNSSNPYYAFKEVDNRLALNLVDMNSFSEEYFEHHKRILKKAIDFINQKSKEGKKVLIHCNKGESRSPAIAMLYLASIGRFSNKDFEETEREFIKIYPLYNPKGNIKENVKRAWNCFIKGK